MAAARRHRLTMIIKRYLDIAWYACIGALIVIPIVLIAFVPRIGDSDKPPPDVPLYLSFTVDQEALAFVDGPPALAEGTGELRIRTRVKSAWYLSLAVIELVVVVFFYGIGKMRGLFASLLRGDPFDGRNAGRVRKIGYAVVGWHIVAPFLKYLGASIVLRDVVVPGLVLKPPVDFSLEGLVVGLAVVVLAEVFQQASVLQQDQSLTV